MDHPIPSQRILPTLNRDGTRRLVRPKLFSGSYHKRRRIVGWSLIALFVGLPFVRLGGKPAVLLDIPHRQFTLLGHTFLPTDGVLLAFLMLSVFVGVFLVTALLGRAWCGWGCPQTVYLEFVFRPIEQWLEGSRGQQLKLDKEGPNAKRVLKWGIFGLLSVAVANVFLAYFVRPSELLHWMTHSPFEHPTGALVVLGASALVFFDFAYFREQMCTVICPYARLQSALLDRRSLIVGYDRKRGEPRGGGRAAGGDCIDCKACVIACPTGIDIRDGLQLECVSCTQCVDACNSVMQRLKKPEGLIRYASQDWFATGKQGSWLRPRVLVYSVLVLGLLTGLLLLGREHSKPAEVTVLRGIGAPFVARAADIQNQLRIKVANRGEVEQVFAIAIEDAGDSQLIAPENPLHVAAGGQATTTVFVLSPRSAFSAGTRPIEVVVSSPDGFTARTPYHLLGP
ncbi:MAG TPA: cytochrome c oxidase accessory protein CcoG [Polyangiaceae bacterium]|jgi:cytochrome c oxidase accessory protein FixG|nr:cytochrome c oxidase accessory protein CcoG [Polyangiaceae bacterium]